MKKLQPFIKVLSVFLTGSGTYIYAMFQGGFVSWFLFYSTALVILLTVIFALMPIGQIEVKRKLNAQRLVAGEDLKVTITITRNSFFPFPYFIVEDVFQEDWKLKNSQMNSKEMIYPTFKKQFSYSYSVKKLKRGEYQFSEIKLRTSDFLGIFIKEKVVEVKDGLVVYPKFQKLNKWNMYNENEAEAYLTSQKVIEDITSVAGSREYVPGDRLTSIDWKVTARVNKLMTKEFEEYLGQRFLIVVDCSLKDRSDVKIFEKAIELATSFTVHSYEQHHPLGLLTIGEKVGHYPVQFGEAHQGNLLEHLAKLHFHFGNTFDVSAAKEMNKIATDTIVIIISTRLTEAIVENVRNLKEKRVLVAFCFVKGQKGLADHELISITQIKELQVPCYVIVGNSFQKELKGGETVAQKS